LIKEKHLVQGVKSELETKLEEKTQQISNLQETIKDLEAAKIDMHTEVTVHQEQKTTALAQLQRVEASLKNLENQLDQQREKNSDMTNDIDRLDKQLVDVKSSLHGKIVALHQEKDATLLELQKSQASISNFENVIEQQNKECSSLQQANDELQKTIYTLTKKSEQGKAKLQEDVARLDKKLVELRRSLHTKIAALHEDKDATLIQL
jgi:chromosome segregation ATPase